ncbi:MAG: NADP-dependent malic enzyme [Paracoccaceae bacterium]|nr:NADP-dependent malic enzyme [Paracoccaceae bacterium]MDG1368831.1 NADP-dependent malic enzyme [Paracoccaceae bacterium]
MSDKNARLDEEALAYHFTAPAGKLEVVATKPMATQRDLSLAYSPGVAAPVRAIAEDPETAFDYTARGNMVAVISNGTAILGLGNLGALASKPVMEGKAVLFKRFADVNCIDLELDTEDADEFINAVKLLGPSFGGINLEDIKAPDCFIIEQRLREEMDIPVFHDDQHGTAIICVAGLINALHLTDRKIEDVKIVLNGAGAAGIACIELVKSLGAKPENCIACDTRGVIYQGRESGMNQWKSAHAIKTEARSLADAVKDADVFLGVSAKGALTPEMLLSMASSPIIFAMANPDPEITPEDAHEVREDAIVATGRSDYPNQVNNVLGFPFIFRGALDVNARTINEEMKIAAANALAQLAREDVPDEVAAAYGGRTTYGPEYIIPAPFDPRLIHVIPMAVAQAAMDTGVARRPIMDMEVYELSLRARLDPTANMLEALTSRARNEQRSVIFAEGQDERVLRAAVSYARAGLGEAIVVGRQAEVASMLKDGGMADAINDITVMNSELTEHLDEYTDMLYAKLQRRGFLRRDCYRRVARDRHIFSSAMLAAGHADAMVTGVTRKSAVVLDDIGRVFDTRQGQKVVGVSAVLTQGRTVLVADTMVHEMPTGPELADISEQAAGVARRLGLEPRVALLSYSTFGYPTSERSDNLREATLLLEERGVDFEFDGEMAADVALDPDAMAAYPFCRLTGPANVLVMPARHSASISTKMLQQLEGTTVIGPILTGLERPVQICAMNATVSDILNMAVIAATKVG